MRKKLLISIIIVVLIIIFLSIIILFGTPNRKSSYKIKNAKNQEEKSIATEYCNGVIKYLEDKYNEKFYVTFTWQSLELSRVYSVSAYSFENPDKEFSIQILYPQYNNGKSYKDNYIFEISKNDVTEYFYGILDKYNIINREDFAIMYSYDLDTTNISKEAFNKDDSINLSIYLDNEKFSRLEENMNDIAVDLNNSISANRSRGYPNFYINVYTKEEDNYDDTIENDNYLDIQIYKDNSYTARRVHSFPENLFKNVTD